MTVPVLEGFTFGDGSDDARTDLTATKPSGVASGDFLPIVPMNDSTGGGPEFADDLTDWDLRVSEGDGTSDAHVGVYERISDAGESASETVTAATSGLWSTYYMRISGVDQTTPIHVFNSGIITDQGTTKTIPEITTTIDDCLIFYGMVSDGADVLPVLTTANGWTAGTDEDAADQITLTSFPTSGICSNFGSRGLATAGATGDVVLARTVGDTAAWFMMAVAPVAADGTRRYRISSY